MTAATTAAATTTEFASLHDGIQLRSSSFQLIKVFFDEEATSDRIERFRALLLKLRYPASIYGFFCFSQTYSKMNLACTGISRSGLQASEISTNNGNNMNGDNNPESDIGNSLTPLESGDFYAPSLKSKEKSADALRTAPRTRCGKRVWCRGLTTESYHRPRRIRSWFERPRRFVSRCRAMCPIPERCQIAANLSADMSARTRFKWIATRKRCCQVSLRTGIY